MHEAARRHLRACGGFASATEAVDDRWDAPTPCADWCTRDVVEHVIGFHEVLWLRPAGIRAHRPKDGAVARWQATLDAIRAACADDAALATVDPSMIAALSTDVLVHTWDLCRAVAAPLEVDEELWARAEAGLPETLPGPMYGPAIDVMPDATVVARVVARCGRDPSWPGFSGDVR